MVVIHLEGEQSENLVHFSHANGSGFLFKHSPAQFWDIQVLSSSKQPLQELERGPIAPKTSSIGILMLRNWVGSHFYLMARQEQEKHAKPYEVSSTIAQNTLLCYANLNMMDVG